jgi:6-phosphogluconolactonase/glucosamine-6-phosphate isomerase/deaminase
MKFRRFDSYEKMTAQVVDLLTTHLRAESVQPKGITLSGGLTPQPAYRRLTAAPVKASPSTHILFSDERMVPILSPENNFGNARSMISAVGVSEQRVLRVSTELALVDAATRYEQDLAAFLKKGGKVTLGLLGLGADGHTASIFSREDVEAGRGRYALAVPKEGQPSRVTVTADFLSLVDCIIFIASGADKAAIVKTLMANPESIPAGLAVAGARDVHLWVS